MARAYADISVELGHFYLRDLVPGFIEATAEREAEWLRPILDRHREQGRSVSCVVMLDDYFVPEGRAQEVAEGEELVLEAYERAGLPVDHVVRELDCAKTVKGFVDGYLLPPGAPAGETGTRTTLPPLTSSWLSNADPPRDRPRVAPLTSPFSPESAQQRTDSSGPSATGRPTGEHSIHLDIELWSGEGERRVWSCPLLAAWWHLIRLGLARVDNGDRSIDEDIGRKLHGEGPPLAALRSLTVLSPAFLIVENAVRTILEQAVIADPEWRRHMRVGSAEAADQVHLDCIGYLFPPPGRHSS
ncbi:MAG: hypothetical protein ACR2ML_03810 [Solirubrobacteraceae bacterium]